MNKITNKAIQGLWIGKELSIMEQLSIQSFLKNGHDYHLYVYSDVKNIPEGTLVKDGNEILSGDKIFTHQAGFGKGSYAGFADYFRFTLLLKKGGWWADTDVICLKNFNFQEERIIASTYEQKWGEPASNCVLKLPQNDPLLIYITQALDQMDLQKSEFGQPGVFLLQKAVSELNYQQYIVSHKVFCPITWRAVNKRILYHPVKLTPHIVIDSVKDLIRPVIRPCTKTGRVSKSSYAVHLWHEIWRQNQFDKDATYDKNCLYEYLKRKYL